MGIGELRLGMSLQKMNQVLGTRIVAKKANKTLQDFDTVKITYKGIAMLVCLSYTGYQDNAPETSIYGLAASSSLLSTKSGVQMGMDKFEVIKKLDGMELHVGKDWRKDEHPEKKRFSTVALDDYDNGSQLIMFFIDNKLTGFEVIFNEGC